MTADNIFYSVVDINTLYTPYWDEGDWAVAVDAVYKMYDNNVKQINLFLAILGETNPISYSAHMQLAITDKEWKASNDIICSHMSNINIVTQKTAPYIDEAGQRADTAYTHLHKWVRAAVFGLDGLTVDKNPVDTYTQKISAAKCYQISECMMLLAINKTLISSIKDLISCRQLPVPVPVPKAYSHILEQPPFLTNHVLKNLKDNPWIKQYMELFQPLLKENELLSWNI